MAKKAIRKIALNFSDIVLGAEADVIKKAYEARMQIDTLLDERSQAYQRINELEEQVEATIGTPGLFQFPAPPIPVAGYSKLQPVQRPVAPAKTPESVDSEKTIDAPELEKSTTTNDSENDTQNADESVLHESE